MDKKGFTLVELIGVISLLAVLVVIVSINVVKIVSDTNNELDNASKKVLFSATDIYLDEEEDVKPNDTYKVYIRDLLDKDKISTNFVNSHEQLTNDSCVIANFTNGYPSYKLLYKCE